MRAIANKKLAAHKVAGRFKEEWRIEEADLLTWLQRDRNDTVALPVAVYMDMTQTIQAYSSLVVKVMDELGSIKDAQAAQEARQDERDKRLVEVMRLMLEEKQKKKPGLWARLWGNG